MSEPVPAPVAGHGSAIVLTTRLNQLSVSTAMSLAQAGFCPVVALMGQSGARRRRQVLAEYGWLYSVEQLASAIARKLWLQRNSGALASIKVVELSARDWAALISMAEELRCCAVVSASFAYRIPKEVVDAVGRCLNVHPAPLPGWKGADPVFWMMRAGLREYGVTLHAVTEGFDEGGVCFESTFRLRGPKFRPVLERQVAEAVRLQVGAWVADVVDGRKEPLPQHGEGYYWPLPTLANRKRLRAKMEAVQRKEGMVRSSRR